MGWLRQFSGQQCCFHAALTVVVWNRQPSPSPSPSCLPPRPHLLDVASCLPGSRDAVPLLGGADDDVGGKQRAQVGRVVACRCDGAWVVVCVGGGGVSGVQVGCGNPEMECLRMLFREADTATATDVSA